MCLSLGLFIYFLASCVKTVKRAVRRKERESHCVFFPVIKSWRGDDVKAVCVPGEVFMALLESRWAALRVEIMDA